MSPREIRQGEEVAWYADGDTILRTEHNPSIAYAYVDEEVGVHETEGAMLNLELDNKKRVLFVIRGKIFFFICDGENMTQQMFFQFCFEIQVDKAYPSMEEEVERMYRKEHECFLVVMHPQEMLCMQGNFFSLRVDCYPTTTVPGPATGKVASISFRESTLAACVCRAWAMKTKLKSDKKEKT
ncbi:hypothetical protein PHJA_000834200 [Phtheirospermum japonicum]|uniref:Uncharacterized protein n=1 Tax=Phtheirospermum japonicum TaxID=374723 RepID=A0A830BR03_9LAMI|nr:hypothetical protein PHJA_000834200 [Phtheirospermum japonicum]